MKEEPTLFDRTRVNIDESKWAEVQFDDTIDITGKNLHILQLPPDMPVQCLDGIKLPVTKDNDWSNPVRITYTVDSDNSDEIKKTVEIIVSGISEHKDTLMQVKNGKLVSCKVKPKCVYVGYEVFEDVETESLPATEKKVHELPEGLKQRFIPIGNKHMSSTKSTVQVKKPATTKSRDSSSPKKRKKDKEHEKEKKKKKRE